MKTNPSNLREAIKKILDNELWVDDEGTFGNLNYCQFVAGKVETIDKLLSLLEKEVLGAVGKDVNTRTWGRFFKGSSVEGKNDSRSLDIKCAYTNGFNKRGDETRQNIRNLFRV